MSGDLDEWPLPNWIPFGYLFAPFGHLVCLILFLGEESSPLPEKVTTALLGAVLVLVPVLVAAATAVEWRRGELPARLAKLGVFGFGLAGVFGVVNYVHGGRGFSMGLAFVALAPMGLGALGLRSHVENLKAETADDPDPPVRDRGRN